MRFAVLFLFLTATLTYAKDEDVAFSRFSLSTYFSSRSMQFAPLDDGKEIRPATLETYEVSSGTYSSDIKYRVAGERDAHSLAELGLRARAYSGNVEKATMMTNFEFDILFDSKFEYFQSRLMGDMGIMFNPLPSLLIGPAV
ncbi:MAG TPA: hypothetical protein PLY93_15165, partial [Turneriella sp.]|nr:hypothetical protein [Turneriella sp.]